MISFMEKQMQILCSLYYANCNRVGALFVFLFN